MTSCVCGHACEAHVFGGAGLCGECGCEFFMAASREPFDCPHDTLRRADSGYACAECGQWCVVLEVTVGRPQGETHSDYSARIDACQIGEVP